MDIEKWAEYEHQFKVIDEAQKMFVVRETDVEGHQSRLLGETEEGSTKLLKQ